MSLVRVGASRVLNNIFSAFDIDAAESIIVVRIGWQVERRREEIQSGDGTVLQPTPLDRIAGGTNDLAAAEVGVRAGHGRFARLSAWEAWRGEDDLARLHR